MSKKWKWTKPTTSWGYDYSHNWNKKTYGLFQTEMTGTTSVFGRDKGVEITFEGERAFAREGQINFPNLDMSMEMDDDAVTLCRGFVDHHAAKLRYSDRHVLNGMQQAHEKSNPLLWNLFDAVETIRTEAKYTDEYPGAKKNLSEMADEQAKKFKKKNGIGFFEKMPLSKVAPIAIAAKARKNMSYFGFGLNDVISTLEGEDKEIVDGWAEAAAECKSSEDAVSLATQIFEYIKENTPPQQENCEGDGEGGGGEESDKDDKKDKGKKNKKDKKDKKKNDKKDQKKSDKGDDGDDGEDEQEQPSSGGSSGEGDDEEEQDGESDAPLLDSWDGDDREQEQPFDFMPKLDDIVDEGIKWNMPKYDGSGENAPYKTFTKKYDRVHHWNDKHPGEPAMKNAYNPRHYFAGQWMRHHGNIGAYMKKAETLGPTINVARRKLELMIAAQRRIEWDYLKDRGKFDSKRMVAALAADPNVFKTKENAADIDTAVSVVIDLSGSMNDGIKRSVATDTAIVLFECLTKIGIPLEIIGFDCSFAFPSEGARTADKSPDRGYDQRDKNKCGRYGGLHTYVFKAFRDKPFDARPYIMGLNSPNIGSSNNSDGESLLVAHERLERRPEKRKIMFVLSDGSPATECYSHNQQYNYLRSAIDQMEKKGTNVIGIGITTTEVSKFYPKFVVCNDAKDLTGTALNLLSELLLPKKKRA